jgi:threonine synthase
MPVNPNPQEIALLSANATTASSSPSSFVKYRSLLFPYRVAASLGMSDAAYVDLVTSLDAKIKAIDGTGFHTTPCLYDPSHGALCKNESGSVAGSHKARHLFNVMTYLLVLHQMDPSQADMKQARRLAVASCGNAGLAAATIASAAQWPIDVCIPDTADPNVVAKLKALGDMVNVVPCARDVPTVKTPFGPVAADTEADPTVAVFKNLVKDHNSIPFSVQGNECGMAVEGMHTLAWEILAQAKDMGLDLDFENLFVQVGGGALGAGLIQGMERAHRGDLEGIVPGLKLESVPKLVCVQAEGNAPLGRAFGRMREAGKTAGEAAKERGTFMFPWANPASVAGGILDDETYDWVELSRGMETSGGGCLVVNDESICKANDYIKNVHQVNACLTGSVGLAGLMNTQSESGKNSIVIFSGVDRTTSSQ